MKNLGHSQIRRIHANREKKKKSRNVLKPKVEILSIFALTYQKHNPNLSENK